MLNATVNEAQSKAITHGEGPMLVLAGPGSGKTLVITQRIKYLIEEKQVKPEHILVITFTKAAALEMQKRFLSISENKILPVMFGTFHAIFYHILRQTGQYHRKRKRHLLRVRRAGASASEVSSGIFCLFKGQCTSADSAGLPARCKVLLPVSHQ